MERSCAIQARPRPRPNVFAREWHSTFRAAVIQLLTPQLHVPAVAMCLRFLLNCTCWLPYWGGCSWDRNCSTGNLGLWQGPCGTAGSISASVHCRVSAPLLHDGRKVGIAGLVYTFQQCKVAVKSCFNTCQANMENSSRIQTCRHGCSCSAVRVAPEPSRVFIDWQHSSRRQ